MFSTGIHAPNLETYENKSHQVHILDLQTKEHSSILAIQVQQI
jgi:hypothetical protein